MGAFRSSIAILSGFACLAGIGLAAEDRIAGPILTPRAEVSERTVALTGNIRSKARLARDRGAVASETLLRGVKLVLAQTDAQQAALSQFLEAQGDPFSTEYRNWLTPEQYGERFGMSDNDIAAISAWLQSSGFTIEKVARARNWITFNGTAGQISQSFHTEIHRIEIDGETHFANTSEPRIPLSLAGIVAHIGGLDDFHPKPRRATLLPHPDFNASNGAHYLSPDDLATIYNIQPLYKAGFDGTGQKLVIAGQTDLNLADLRAFRAEFNLPASDPRMVLFGADPGSNQADQTEATLDLEWSGAVARNATLVYVYSQDVFDSLQYAIDQNLAPVVSVSYGGCEFDSPASFRTVAQQANAQGITWMNAAGDSGAAGCDSGDLAATQGPAATFPADIPEVTAVGGTEFNEGTGSYWGTQNGATLASALSYIPEKAWNDTSPGSGLAAGGGAASLVYAKPWWQAAPGVPADNARDVPDVSLAASAAHDGYVLYLKGQLMVVGGTSASSPSFAGMVSILNQFLAAQGTISKPGLGNINPALYQLAQNTAGVFHDVTVGNNIVPCAAGSKGCVTGSFGYSAGPGYDLATGLGSVDAYNLVMKWVGLPPAIGTQMGLSASPATTTATGTVLLSAAVTAVTGSNAPVGTVSFSLGGAVLGSAVLAGAGNSATATLPVKGATLAPGTNILTAAYSDSSSFTDATAATTVVVTSVSVGTATTVTASPGAIARTASTVLTATVKQAAGSVAPSGSVTFTAGTLSLGTAKLALSPAGSASGAVATLTVGGTALATGANTLTATYQATANFGSSSGSVTVTLAAPAVATVTTLSATPAAVATSGNLTLSASVKPATGTAAPTGNVTFSVGNKILGSTALAGSSSTAAISVSGSSFTPGSNSVVASYAGNAAFSGSVSSPADVIVSSPAKATSTSLTLTLTAGEQAGFVLTAFVKSTSGTALPTGNVSFTIGSTLLGTAPVASVAGNTTAILPIKGSILPIGKYTITANYTGTGNFLDSSTSIGVIVSAAPNLMGQKLVIRP